MAGRDIMDQGAGTGRKHGQTQTTGWTLLISMRQLEGTIENANEETGTQVVCFENKFVWTKVGSRELEKVR
jgi:hypothetical protein